MMLGRTTHFRATGLVRTVVVAAATLGILLVCFTVYQQSQFEPHATPVVRLPPVPTAPSGTAVADPPIAPATTKGVDIGSGRVGPGEKVQLTIYEPDGNRARLEIAVDDWTPLEGSTSEFVLTRPEVRLRTKDGHAVRVTARRGVLEAQRRVGGGLDPKRGQLSGDVVIQYDRLTRAQRAELPPQERDVDPRDLIEARVELIEFDLEYLKLLVPGTVRLDARDVRLDAADLEVRFSDAEDRVEYLRINQGGTLELLESHEQLGLSIPATDAATSELSLTQWLRAALEAKLAAQQKVQKSEATEKKDAGSGIIYTAEGVPVFRLDEEKSEPPSPPLRYRARFEGAVEARQVAGGETHAFLTGDLLEIVRVFSAEDRAQIDSSEATRTPATDESDPSGSGGPRGTGRPTESRHVLTWTTRLVVDVCGDQDARCAAEAPSSVLAVGNPVRIHRTDGEATCRRLEYQPDGSAVSLIGTIADPVIVRYSEEGTVIGTAVHSQRRGNETTFEVTGPGTLIREAAQGRNTDEVTGDRPAADWVVEFAQRLDAQGRFVTRPRVHLAGGVTLVKRRVLDRADFHGSVRMYRGDTELSADTLSLSFRAPNTAGDGLTIERALARGHVIMTQGPDHLRCREMEVVFGTGPGGQAVPDTATARGDVVVEQQDGGTIEARDKLIVEFGSAAAGNDGKDPADGQRATVNRVRAFGDVRVRNPRQDLEVRSDHLECTVAKDRKIEEAVLEGDEKRPAWARVETFTIAGKRIRLNLAEESANVPGPGRLTFQSEKDLDGRRAEKPIPVTVSWHEGMDFDGDANRLVFEGDVHAVSETQTTFDCQRLLVEFIDTPAAKTPPRPTSLADWWIVKELAQRIAPASRSDKAAWQSRPAKEPVYILATGSAIALTAETDPATGRLKSRARIAGPQLAVDLRPEVSKMVIEGAGTLLLEDYAREASESPPVGGGLFGVNAESGPSNTLIEWRDLMWYDFSIDQTRFEGQVNLKHFSGARLAGVRGPLAGSSAGLPPGRATYLQCDVLTVDFSDPRERNRRSPAQRMGRISAERLKQFQATGSVVLQDESEGLSLTADRVVFWKNRDVLGVFGGPARPTHIVIQRPGQLPNQLTAERLFYDLARNQWELSKPSIKTR